MPKTYITRQQKLNNKLIEWIYGKMGANRITQQQIANAIGIAQPSVNRKLKKCNFTFQDLTAIFEILKPDEEDLMKLMGVK